MLIKDQKSSGKPSLGPRDAKAKPLEPNADYPGKSESSFPLVKAGELYQGHPEMTLPGLDLGQ